MDKSRERDRDGGSGSDRNSAAAAAVAAAAAAGLPPGLDPATAALYAPWMSQEQALLSSMLSGGAGAAGANSNAAAAQGGMAGYAAMAALAAQQQQAAALAALGQGGGGGAGGSAAAAAAWYNFANLQQMEMVARLQQHAAATAGGPTGAGPSPYGQMHPHHLLGLEMLHQQQAMMAAAQMAQKGSSPGVPPTSSSGSNRASKLTSSGGGNSNNNANINTSRNTSSTGSNSSNNSRPSSSNSASAASASRGGGGNSARDYLYGTNREYGGREFGSGREYGGGREATNSTSSRDYSGRESGGGRDYSSRDGSRDYGGGRESSSSRDYRADYAVLAREYAAAASGSAAAAASRRQQQEHEFNRLIAAAAASGNPSAAASARAAAAAYFGGAGGNTNSSSSRLPSSTASSTPSSSAGLPYGIAHLMGDSGSTITTTAASSKHSSSSSSASNRERETAAALLLQQQQLLAAAAASNPAALAYHHQQQQQLQHLQHLQQLHHLQQLQKSAAVSAGSSSPASSSMKVAESSSTSSSNAAAAAAAAAASHTSSSSTSSSTSPMPALSAGGSIGALLGGGGGSSSSDLPDSLLSARLLLEAAGLDEAAARAATSGAGMAGSGGRDDGPLNLSLKAGLAAAAQRATDKRDRSLDAAFRSANLLQSLSSHHHDNRDVFTSMQEVLQRQLLAADEKKREEKKKRMEEAQERSRALGRGTCKPKKNTVASLLEHCRAAGIKPTLPLPPDIQSSLTGGSSSSRSAASALSGLGALASSLGVSSATANSVLGSLVTAASGNSSDRHRATPTSSNSASQHLAGLASLATASAAGGNSSSSLSNPLTSLSALSSLSAVAAAAAAENNSTSTSNSQSLPPSLFPHSLPHGLTATPLLPSSRNNNTPSSNDRLMFTSSSSVSTSSPSLPPLSSSVISITSKPPSSSSSNTATIFSITSLANSSATPSSVAAAIIPATTTTTISSSTSSPASLFSSTSSATVVPIPPLKGLTSMANIVPSSAGATSSSATVLSLPPSLSISSCLSITSINERSKSPLVSQSDKTPIKNNKPIVSILPASALIAQTPLSAAEDKEDSDSQSRKRHHVVTSSSHDGRLLTTIRMTSDSISPNMGSSSPPHTLNACTTTTTINSSCVSSNASGGCKTPDNSIAGNSAAAASLALLMTRAKRAHHKDDADGQLSGSDSEDSDLSSMDDDGSFAGNNSSHAMPSPWISDRHNDISQSPPAKRRRKMVTDENLLRVPLEMGWRRETNIRCISNSGVRGEVIYYAPCGKIVRQYPDIIRYLERNNINEVTRDNFSFSSKLVVGEYYDSNTSMRFTEAQIHAAIKEVRGGYGGYGKHNAAKDQDRIKRLDEYKKEKEEQRKQKEELNRQRLYEQLRKAQEREQEKHKQKLVKEQDRERRRYHGVLVRCIEARKKYEDREKRKEEIREEKRISKERKRCQREAARELNLLMKEVHEDMELTDHADLPSLQRCPNIYLSPSAAANVIMIAEFLSNFGSVLGFDMDTLPSLSSLQSSVLSCCSDGSEDEMVSVLCHLLVCAIEDPGVVCPSKYTTLLGQPLSKADVTPSTVSEILRVYFTAAAYQEVRIIMCGSYNSERDKKDFPEKAVEWDVRIKEHSATRMAGWLVQVPFAALNPSQKTEVVAYIINDLLQNKSVLKQIETSLDKHNSLKTEKWKLDAKIRKLRMSISRKRIYQSSLPEHRIHNDDSNLSVSSSGADKKKDAGEDDDEEMEEGEESAPESDAGMEDLHDHDEGEGKTDASCAELEKLQEQMEVIRQQLFDTAAQVRATNCGQDRYQRTMWMLPHCGGPFLEGLSSCDYLSTQHFPHEVPDPQKKLPLMVTQPQSKEGKDEENFRWDNGEVVVNNGDVNGEPMDCDDSNNEPMHEDDEEIKLPEDNKASLNIHEDIKTDCIKLDPSAVKAESVKFEPDIKNEKVKMELSTIDDIPLPDIPPRIASSVHSVSKLELDGESSNSSSKDPVTILTNNVSSSSPTVTSTAAIACTTSTTSTLSPFKDPLTVNKVEASCVSTPPPPTTVAGGGALVNGISRDSSPVSSNTPVTNATVTGATVTTTHTTTTTNSPSTGVVARELVATGLGLIPGQYLRPEHVAQAEHLSFSLLPRILCCPSSHYLNGVLAECEKSLFESDKKFPPLEDSSKCKSESTDQQLCSEASTGVSSNYATAPNSPASHTASMSQKELLEKLHQSSEALPIPPYYLSGWWQVLTLDEIVSFEKALNERGLRERELRRFLERHKNIIKNCRQRVDKDLTCFQPVQVNHLRPVYCSEGKYSSHCDVDSVINSRVRNSNFHSNVNNNCSLKNSDDHNNVQLTSSPPVSLDPTLPVVKYDGEGIVVPDVDTDWSHAIALKEELQALDYIITLEDKITAASMQNKSWCAVDGPGRPRLNYVPSFILNKFKNPSPESPQENSAFTYNITPSKCLEIAAIFAPVIARSSSSSSSSSSSNKGKSKKAHSLVDDPTLHNAVYVGRERLLKLEDGIERRYLKPPLAPSQGPKPNTAVSSGGTEGGTSHGATSEPTSDSGTDSTLNNNSNGVQSNSSSPSADNSTGSSTADNALPAPDVWRGLSQWRTAVGKCETAAQLYMCALALENAVAWDKSIMKAFCQFCASGDHEEKLLLCDGCDKGYHTHCFRPPMVDIPDGDWFCYECVNKELIAQSAGAASGSPALPTGRHCLVCGGTDGRNLLHCVTCPRSFHATPCANPPVNKIPRNKWHCPACSNKHPRTKRTPRSKKANNNAANNNTSTTAPPTISSTTVTTATAAAVTPTPTNNTTATPTPPPSLSVPPIPDINSDKTPPITAAVVPPILAAAEPPTATPPLPPTPIHPVPAALPPPPQPPPPVQSVSPLHLTTDSCDVLTSNTSTAVIAVPDTPPAAAAPIPFSNNNSTAVSHSPALHAHNNNVSSSAPPQQDNENCSSNCESLTESMELPQSDPPMEVTEDNEGSMVQEYSPSGGPNQLPNTPKKERPAKKLKEQVQLCRLLLTLLEEHTDSWPFLQPVNTRHFPAYKKVIRKPMDLSVIKRKLEDGSYKSPLEFSDDLQLMFNNCETFNEDDSPVGKAGHSLRAFCNQKWADLFPSS